MKYKYGSNQAFQALITKAEGLINSVSSVATSAQTNASKAIADAAAAQKTADQANAKTLTDIAGILSIAKGGTGATSAAKARTNLGITPANIGAAASTHNHAASEITSGALAVARGGTGATSASAARTNLGITPANIGAAASSHKHAASDLSSAVPISLGGTGATDAETARENLEISLTTLGAAAASHNHSASNITSGTLAVARGGTGITKNPSMLVNLASGSAASTFATSPRPGVTGTLPVSNGGTGLTASPSMLVNLASTSAANVMTASPRPGITGTLPVANGGTGSTSASAARTALSAAEGYNKSATVSTAGWYRIATSASGISNNIGVFSLRGTVSGKHTNIVFAAGVSFGYNPEITQILASCSSTLAITKLRLVYTTSYSGKYAYLEYYTTVTASTTIDVAMTLSDGWSLVAPNTAGSVPSGYSSKEITIANGQIGGYTASRALVTNSSGVITESAVTSTELGYLDGVTSAIQTQLNRKAASSHKHAASDLSSAVPISLGGTGATDAETARENLEISLTTLGAAAASHNHSASNITSGTLAVARGGTGVTANPSMLVNLGSTTAAGVFATSPRPGVTGTLPIARGGTGASTAADALTALGAAASSHNHSAANITSGTLAIARGGTGVTANPSMLVNLGSTTAASVFATSPRPGVTGTLPIARGGTGADDAVTARANLGITLANLGAAAASHNHSAANITSGTLAIARGGTGVTANPSMLVNLGSTTAAGVFATSPRPGVTGTLPIARGGTGATTAGTATNSLAAMSLAPGVEIAEDDDMDDYIDPGCYVCSSGTLAATLVNPPTTGSGFMLSVFKTYGLAASNAYRTQIALTYSGNIYCRYRNSSSVWSNWDAWDITGRNYYPTTWTWTAGTTAGPTAKLSGSGMSAVSVGAIPTASASAAGIVTTGAQTFAGTKTFSSTISGSVSGNAATATKLKTARTITVNLASTSGASFNGSANVTPGVSGILPVARGGTGADDAATARTNLGITLANLGAAAASHNHSAANITSGTLAIARGGTGLTASPSMLVNLASTSAANVFAASPRPGVTGTLPIARGGTGSTTAANARNALSAAEGYTKTASVSAAGWYRIATSAAGISNNIGLFSIRGAVSGKHSNIILAAGISYGDYPDITQILVSNFSSPSITKARLVYHGTYNDNYAYLEIYANVSAATTIDVSMTLSKGWTLVAPNTAGSIPKGYTSKEYTLANGTIGGYTASRALVTNSSGVITESAVTSTELGYLDGVTSAIQTQLNAKAASSHNHSASNITSGTLAVARGGTGVTSNPSLLVNLASSSAASVFAASPRPGVTGTLPIARGGTGATSAAAALTALGAASRAYYTCSVATSSWTANSGGGYYKTITVSGIRATDVPVVGVVLSSTVETAKLQGAAFACINRITTATNSITCYAYNSAPTTAITLQLLVVR